MANFYSPFNRPSLQQYLNAPIPGSVFPGGTASPVPQGTPAQQNLSASISRYMNPAAPARAGGYQHLEQTMQPYYAASSSQHNAFDEAERQRVAQENQRIMANFQPQTVIPTDPRYNNGNPLFTINNRQPELAQPNRAGELPIDVTTRRVFGEHLNETNAGAGDWAAGAVAAYNAQRQKDAMMATIMARNQSQGGDQSTAERLMRFNPFYRIMAQRYGGTNV